MTHILERRVKALEDLNAALFDFDAVTASAAELNILDGATTTFTDLNQLSSAGNAAAIGAVAGSGVACAITRTGATVKLDFTLTAVAITWTDAAGSGASGSIKIFDLVAGAWQSLACRTNLTLTSDTTMDVAGDMVGVFALGSVAANAGDGVLTSTEVDFVCEPSTSGSCAALKAAGITLFE